MEKLFVISIIDLIDRLGHEIGTRAVPAGDLLFGKGEGGQSLFIVRQGGFMIGDGPVIFEEVGDGSVIGEMALIDDEPRSAWARATVQSEVTELGRPDFLALVRQDPEFALQLLRLLSMRLRAMNQRLVAP